MPDDDKDFAAGFGKAQEAKAISTEPPAQASSAQASEPAQSTEAQPSSDAQEPAQPAGESGPTEKTEAEQLREFFAAELARRDQENKAALEALRADLRKNFGQIGEVKSTTAALRSEIAARNPSKLDPVLVEQLAKDADEELPGLGAVLKKHLPAMLQGNAGAVAQVTEAAKAAAQEQGTAFNPTEFYEKSIAPALAQLETRVNVAAELRVVKALHRDFDQVMKDPAFAAWIATLPAERQTYYRDSEDGLVAAEAITEFKAAKEAAAKDKDRKQNRLEAAVQPKGAPRQPAEPPNDDDDFLKGFSRRRTA